MSFELGNPALYGQGFYFLLSFYALLEAHCFWKRKKAA